MQVCLLRMIQKTLEMPKSGLTSMKKLEESVKNDKFGLKFSLKSLQLQHSNLLATHLQIVMLSWKSLRQHLLASLIKKTRKLEQ